MAWENLEKNIVHALLTVNSFSHFFPPDFHCCYFARCELQYYVVIFCLTVACRSGHMQKE
jgi:hypothetical protein